MDPNINYQSFCLKLTSETFTVKKIKSPGYDKDINPKISVFIRKPLADIIKRSI